MLTRNYLIIGSVALAHFTNAATMLAETTKGPSSSATSYVVNVAKSVDIVAILTVGDSVSAKPISATAYRMVGIPDGLGAFDNCDGTFTVLMNHELGPTLGVAREHGLPGAFVSHWIVRKSDLAVLHGGDQIKKLIEWDSSSGKFVSATRAIGRLCSADLPLPSAFFDRKSGKGYIGRIFMDGEEVVNDPNSGIGGRAFAHIVTGPGAGISYELPSLGQFAWENSVASPYEQERTVAIGMDDSTPGQVYVYIGKKQDEGNEIEKAGLHGGNLYGVQVVGFPVEDMAMAPERGMGIASGARFMLHNFGDVRSKTGRQIQDESVANLVTEFLRPEDGAWDTQNPNVFYFVTTDRFDSKKDGSGIQVARPRLHRLTFDKIEKPEEGGRYDMLLDGTGDYQMLDNMTVDGDGNLILQEDPGNQARLARIWKFYPSSGALVEIAKHDPARFGVPPTPPPPTPTHLTIDEESSGVIEITHLLRKDSQTSERNRSEREDEDGFDEQIKWAKRGYRYYLCDTQAHPPAGASTDPELVEGGQLYIIGVPGNVRQAPPRGAIEDANSIKDQVEFRP
jgi:hypothetical protein